MSEDQRRAGLPPSPGLQRGLRAQFRYHLSRAVVGFVVRLAFRIDVEGRERLPGGPAIICFNHLNWIDPFLVLALLPARPRINFLGPAEDDMAVGFKNRMINFTATAVPFRSGRDNLLDTTRRVGAALGSGGILALAGEGRIQPDEHAVLPLQEGTAYFALRNRVPIVPLAISGTSWLRFQGRIRVRVGAPIRADGRPTSEAIAAVTERLRTDLLALLADAPIPVRPNPWFVRLTELFNDWPEGSRPAADAAAAGRRPTGD